MGGALSTGLRLTRRRMPAFVLAGFGALSLGVPPSAHRAAPWKCGSRDGAAPFAHGLPRTARRLAGAEPLEIVAVGSSSTAGFGSSGPSHTYPVRLALYLRARFPERAIRVVNAGAGGETVIDMLARFDRDVLAAAPDLVIWQAGTNALLQDFSEKTYTGALRTGIDRLHEAGSDVVIMNAQYAPLVLQHRRHRRFIAAGDRVAAEEGAALFDRFSLMRRWVERGATFEQILHPDGLHLNDASYDCVARALAQAIAATVSPEPVPARG